MSVTYLQNVNNEPMGDTKKYKDTSIQNDQHHRTTTKKDKYDDIFAESNSKKHHNSSSKVTVTSKNSSKYDEPEVKHLHYSSNSSNKHSHTSRSTCKQNEKDNSFRDNIYTMSVDDKIKQSNSNSKHGHGDRSNNKHTNKNVDKVDDKIKQSNVNEHNHRRSSSSHHSHRERSSNRHSDKSSKTSDSNKYSHGSDSNSKHSHSGRVFNSHNDKSSAMKNDTIINDELVINKHDSKHYHRSSSSKKPSEKSSSNKRHSSTNSDDKRHHDSIFDNKHCHKANELRDDIFNNNILFNENDGNDLQKGNSARHSKTSHRTEFKDRTNTSSEDEKKSNSTKKRLNDEKRSESTKKVKLNGPVDEIDFTMGTSFADALKMVIPTSSHKNKEKDSIKSMYRANTTLTAKAVETIVKTTEELKKSPPSLLASHIKLEPLEVNMRVDMPNISNNYKPMPVNPTVMDCVYTQNKLKSNITDEEAFGSGISSKNMRTKVYSGVRNGNSVKIPSLLELSTRVLYKNIEALEFTGGVPFDILRPVLEKLNATQLSNLEHFNPYLLDDSDYLWKIHCGRKFRGRARMEMESYRDMYMRCLEEQEIRLGQLTESIKQSQTVALPIKQTKLAYMDSIVKPPRNVLKKQHQYGTERKLVATPAARVPTLAKITTNVRPGDVRLRVNGHERDTAQAPSTVMRPKKAPLMLKTLQLMKGRYKR